MTMAHIGFYGWFPWLVYRCNEYGKYNALLNINLFAGIKHLAMIAEVDLPCRSVKKLLKITMLNSGKPPLKNGQMLICVLKYQRLILTEIHGIFWSELISKCSLLSLGVLQVSIIASIGFSLPIQLNMLFCFVYLETSSKKGMKKARLQGLWP